MKQKFRTIFSKRKQDWHIEVSTLGYLKSIMITDHKIEKIWRPIYEKILEFILRGYPAIVLSQYIDEEQGMFDNRNQIIATLSSLYELKIVTTNEYVSEVRSLDKSSQYIVNVMGKPDSAWLAKIVRFGGTSLSNVFYDAKDFGEFWLAETVKRNQAFNNWYWHEFLETDMFKLWSETGFICFTSDAHLFILAEENKANGIISQVNDIANQFSLNIVLKEAKK